jgi:5-methylthioadenosine/S-adenosylhomocysteine deaminase
VAYPHRPQGGYRYAAKPMTITRRALLAGGSAIAVAALTSSSGSDRSAAPGEYTIIRGGRVLTLDPQMGELPRGDVLIHGDRIVEVAPHIDLPGPGITIEAERMLVAPGLVDNHRHLWVTLLRGFSVNHTFNDYFGQVLLTVSPRLTTDDVYLGCLLGAYEALYTGVTTVLDWNHGTNTRDHALSAVAALRDSGIRAVFGYSSPAADSVRPDAPPTVADLDAVQTVVQSDPLVGLAIATRNPESANDAGLQRIAADIAQARQRGVPVTLHTGFGTGRSAPQWLASQGLLGPDITLVHGNAFTPAEMAVVAGAGAWISTSPETELQMGLGAPPLRRMLDAGVRPTVSADVVAAASGDLRVQLRLLLQNQRLLDHLAGRTPPIMPWDTLMPFVTANAAGSLGLGDQIGRLAPGRQADVVLINLADPSMAPVSSAGMALRTAPTSAVDTVLVAGRVVKRDGQLAVGDLGWLRTTVEQARNRLLGTT